MPCASFSSKLSPASTRLPAPSRIFPENEDSIGMICSSNFGMPCGRPSAILPIISVPTDTSESNILPTLAIAPGIASPIALNTSGIISPTFCISRFRSVTNWSKITPKLFAISGAILENADAIALPMPEPPSSTSDMIAPRSRPLIPLNTLGNLLIAPTIATENKSPMPLTLSESMPSNRSLIAEMPCVAACTT